MVEHQQHKKAHAMRSSSTTTLICDSTVTVTLATDQGPVSYNVEQCFGRMEEWSLACMQHCEMQDRDDWPKTTGDFKVTRDGVVIYDSEDAA